MGIGVGKGFFIGTFLALGLVWTGIKKTRMSLARMTNPWPMHHPYVYAPPLLIPHQPSYLLPPQPLSIFSPPFLFTSLLCRTPISFCSNFCFVIFYCFLI